MGNKLTLEQEKALNYSIDISLTANAGSGKTFVLKNRYVNILLENDVSLNNIVAITFTDKAAAKLYKDIATEIDRRINETTDDNIKEKLQNYRKDLISANISTIHSFCLQLLKEFSTEAEIDANFMPIDEDIAKEQIALSFEEVYKEINYQDNSFADIVKYLVRVLGSKKKLYEIVNGLIKKRSKIEEIYKDWLNKSDDELLINIKNKSEERFNLIFGEQLKDTLNKINKINDFVKSETKNKTLAIEIEAILNNLNTTIDLQKKIELLKELKGKVLTSKGEFRKQNYLKNSDEYKSDVEDIVNFKLWGKLDAINIDAEKEYIKFSKNLYLFLKKVVNNYNKRKEENDFLDFEDLLLKTVQVLKNKDVVEILAQRYQYIMVDEYQDTDDVQYFIVMSLLKQLTVNNLFVVGDEKQSIYFFRDADLEIFDITKKKIKEKNDEGNLMLNHSFRVSPKIALFTNNLFGKIMKQNDPIFNEVEYSDLICARKKEDIDKGNIFILLTEKSNSEAESIAIKILEMVKNQEVKDLSDIAILCRQKNDFEDIEKAFSKHKINYTIIGGIGFYQNQMSNDLYHLLNFFHNTKNDFSLIAVLRSPFCGLSDRQLMLISLESGETFFDRLANYVYKDKSIKKIYELLIKCTELIDYTEVYDVLQYFLTESGYWAIIAGQDNSLQQKANLEKFITIVLQAFERSFYSYYDFLYKLNNYIDANDKENQAQVNPNYPSVKIMTIHKSKGLEFDTVFLYGTETKQIYTSLEAKDVKFDKEFGFLTKVPINNNYSDKYALSVWNLLGEAKINKKEEAEHKRVFYVAVTRAINNLIISAKYDSKNNTINSNSSFNYLKEVLKFDIGKDLLNISGVLQFLVDGSKYEKEYLSFDILIIKDLKVDETENIIKAYEEINLADKEFLLNAIIDTTKYETFTASKYLAYNFCPINYNLSYEYNYKKLFELMNNEFNEIDYTKEDEFVSNNDNMQIGVICHEILAKNFDFNKFDEILKINVEKFLFDKETADRIYQITKKLLIPFLQSNQYKTINNYKNSYSEYEINVIIENYYFMGIIDKLIIEDDKIIIIDYKTNSVTIDKVEEKIEYYLPQLKFYAYLVRSLFKEEKEIYVKLIFLALPEYDFTLKIDNSEIEKIERNLFETINNIRAKNFYANTKNCYFCWYNKSCKSSIVK